MVVFCVFRLLSGTFFKKSVYLLSRRCCLCLGAAARPALWAAEALKPPRLRLHRAERPRQQRVQCQNRVGRLFLLHGVRPVQTDEHRPLNTNVLCDLPSAPREPSGQQTLPAAPTEHPGDATSSNSANQGPVGVSSEGDGVTSSPRQRSQPEGSEDTSRGCRRAEPAGEEGEESPSQPAPSNQDSEDSDDDPILIPPTRFRGQGQR